MATPAHVLAGRAQGIALLALSSEQRVIFCVAPNPNPNDFSIPLGCERTMMQTYAGLRDASSIGAATRVQVIQGFVYH
jgi:hypothetical protein